MTAIVPDTITDPPTVHIRVDEEELNSKRKFACGIGPDLPTGHVYFFEHERGAHYQVNCPGCKPFAAPLGTPLSKLSGRPGHAGFDEFCRIAETWGYD